MKIVVIGGTGHIGTYLIPQLVTAGHEVICVSRQIKEPYNTSPLWNSVEKLTIDRSVAEEQGNFGSQISALKAEVVIDLICFTPESAAILAGALLGEVQHFIHCGTMWVHGFSEQVPTNERQERKPFGEYGINKAMIEDYLLTLSREKNFPVTILHPGHITGPGWLPINPAGNLDPDIFLKLANGEEISLPNLGMETVHHVHAFDVAAAFLNAVESRPGCIGESFHVVSEQALTLRGYAAAMSKWFGKEAMLRFLSWEDWQKTTSETNAELTWDHIAHSPNGSIEKAKRLLNYKPRYSSLQAIQEAVNYYFAEKNMDNFK
ncbi:MAG: NAD-dependent epimerase/dehydratase family protein [Ferruginibacter sp.]